MSSDFLRPKDISRSKLFEQRTEELRFRNPMGNEFTERGRTPELPSSQPKRPANLEGTRAGGRNATYNRMLGMEKSITGRSPL